MEQDIRYGTSRCWSTTGAQKATRLSVLSSRAPDRHRRQSTCTQTRVDPSQTRSRLSSWHGMDGHSNNSGSAFAAILAKPPPLNAFDAFKKVSSSCKTARFSRLVALGRPADHVTMRPLDERDVPRTDYARRHLDAHRWSRGRPPPLARVSRLPVRRGGIHVQRRPRHRTRAAAQRRHHNRDSVSLCVLCCAIASPATS